MLNENETPKQTKWTRFKKWSNEHPDFWAGLTMTTIVVGFVATVVWVSVEEQKELEQAADDAKKRVNEINSWVNDQQNAGNVVYALEDGRFLTVDRAAEQTMFIK